MKSVNCNIISLVCRSKKEKRRKKHTDKQRDLAETIKKRISIVQEMSLTKYILIHVTFRDAEADR